MNIFRLSQKYIFLELKICRQRTIDRARKFPGLDLDVDLSSN